MVHNHLSWIQEGRGCTTCNTYFEQTIDLATRFNALTEKLKLLGNVCSTCFTSSFAPCTLDHPSAKRVGNTYMFCQFCWLKKGL